MKKCKFRKIKVLYLGHVTFGKRVYMDTKYFSHNELAKAQIVEGIERVFGLTSYYKRFICNCEKMVRPLTLLLKKGNFGWTKEGMKEI